MLYQHTLYKRQKYNKLKHHDIVKMILTKGWSPNAEMPSDEMNLTTLVPTLGSTFCSKSTKRFIVYIIHILCM